MDIEIEDRVTDMVLSYMRCGDSFTSVDIANRLKDEGEYVRNYLVAEWLRSNAIPTAYKYGHLYNQTLIRVNSKVDGMTLAYLYHHMNVDPDDYLDRDQNPKPYQTPQTIYSGPARVIDNSVPPVVTNTHVTLATKPARCGHDGWRNQRRDSRGRWC